MTDLQVGAIALAGAIGLILLRLPVGLALAIAAFLGTTGIIGTGPALGILSSIPFDFAAHWTLSSVPMFLLMGYVAFHGGLSDGLFNLARTWLSWLPGGLAVATVNAAAGFSAVTGSSLACSAAMGRLAVPPMLSRGYDKGLASGVVAAAGTIGSMIPPSIILLIYGVFAEVSISSLFVAGVLPGILTAFMFCLMIVVRAKLNSSLAPAGDIQITRKERWQALAEVWPVGLLLICVFGGLFSGVFTPTEAGAFGALLSILISMAFGKLNLNLLWQSIKETYRTTASIMLIAIGAALMTRLLALSGVAEFLTDVVGGGEFNQLSIILTVAIVYLLLGMILDPLGIILLTLPLFLPLANELSIDLIWFGIILTKLLELGLVTPPIGMNVFVIKGVVGKSIKLETIFKGVGWFVLTDLITLAILIAFPVITTFLPSLLN